MMSQQNLNRRKFLKIGATTGALGAVGIGFQNCVKSFEVASSSNQNTSASTAPVDGPAAPSLTASLSHAYPVNAREMGAVGDGKADDTLAIQSALDQAGKFNGEVYLPAGIYKTSAPLTMPDCTRLYGAGKMSSIILPTGSFKAAIVCEGGGMNNFLSAVVVQDLQINGQNNFTGVGLYIKYIALRSHFSDLYILGVNGVGMYIEGSFDHNYERIETRGNKSYGIHVYEKQLYPDGVYEEVSKLVFYDCWAIENNSLAHGSAEQWRQEGSDTCSFLECKPSEGAIGINFARNAFGHRITNMMFDGPAPGVGIAIQTNTDYCNQIFISGLQCWNAQYGVNVVDGQNIHVEHVMMNVTGSAVTVGATATGAVYVGADVGYVDHRSAPKTYPQNYHGSWSANLQGIGSKLGNGILISTYVQTGNSLTFTISLTAGTSTIIGAGTGFTIPIAAATITAVSAVAIQSVGSAFFSIQAFISGQAVVCATTTSYVSTVNPFNWTVGDRLIVSGSYIIA